MIFLFVYNSFISNVLQVNALVTTDKVLKNSEASNDIVVVMSMNGDFRGDFHCQELSDETALYSQLYLVGRHYGFCEQALWQAHLPWHID